MGSQSPDSSLHEEKGIKDNHALQAYFNQRILKILQKHGKKMIGWDEILHPDLPRDAVIQSWRGPAFSRRRCPEGLQRNSVGGLLHRPDFSPPRSTMWRIRFLKTAP